MNILRSFVRPRYLVEGRRVEGASEEGKGGSVNEEENKEGK